MNAKRANFTIKKMPLIKVVRGVFAFAIIAIAPGCGADSTGSSAPAISYQLEYVATGATSNKLILEYPEGTEYQVRLTSDDAITSDLALDERNPLQKEVTFSYESAGSYSVGLEIFQANGTPYLQDTLTWAFSAEVPDDPIVSFSEEATADTSVTLQIAGNKSANTKEIWVEGDLAGSHANGGFWDTLPESNSYPLQITSDDGVKTVKVKVRNIYGNESNEVTATITKKSDAPTDCHAYLAGTGSDSRSLKMELFATTSGPLYYNVYGDVEAITGYQQFTSGSQVTIKLSSGEGQKELTVKIRDSAGNYCNDIVNVVDLSADYSAQVLKIKDEPLWTTASSVDLEIRYDHFPSANPMEMRITGSVSGSNTNDWISYAQTATVNLSSGSGKKTIFVQFRDDDGNESFLISTAVFRDPGVTIEDAVLPSKSIIVDKITGLSSVTITGCTETYNDVAYATSYACLPNTASVTVDYKFEDDTTYQVSKNF